MCDIGVPILGLISHTRKVQNLYKKILRTLESYYDHRPAFRYQAAIIRDKFEQNRCVKCKDEIDFLVKQAEEACFLNQHYHLRRFPHSYGGVAYERHVEAPDWILDYWHPLEKAKYPNYFACREERKKEYIEWYNKKYDWKEHDEEE